MLDHGWRLVGNKTGVTRLGFSLLLKFFEIEARFRGDLRAYLTVSWAARARRVLISR